MSEDIKVNLMPEENEKDKMAQKQTGQKTAKRKNSKIKKIIASIVIIVVIILAVFSSSVVFSDESLTKNLSALNLVQKVGHLILSRDKSLAGEKDNRINVLIIGIGGKNHEGGTLADTILLGAIKPSTKEVALMSLPRDLVIPTKRWGSIKINAVHAYAEAAEKGSGGEAMMTAIDNLLKTKINYYVVVDFEGFKKIIDEFGGVDVYVENDLIDPEYPIRGKEQVYPIENRYEYLKIKKGQHHMDGDLALKYARSRHALGSEGSDFARSARQQKILIALKDKIFSINTLFSPRRIKSLLTAYRQHIMTNLEIWEIIKLAQMGKEINISDISTQTLTDDPDGLLYADNINGAYVLIPKDGNYTAIKNIWQYIFYADNTKTFTNKESTPPTTPEPKPEPVTETTYQDEKAKIEIQNGTWSEGLAGREKTKLNNQGFNVVKATNADRHNYLKTLVYDLSSGANPLTANQLHNLYGMTPSTKVPLTISSTADFVIILGKE